MLARPGRLSAPLVLLLALATRAGGALPGEAQARKKVLLVTTPRMPAYEECAEGIRQVLERAGLAVAVAEAGSREMELALTAAGGDFQATIAVGTAAHEALRPHRVRLPSVTTMVLAPPPPPPPGTASEGPPPRATITLEVPPGLTLEQIHRLFPERKRIGLIRGAHSPPPRAQAVALAARRAGLAVTIVECSTMEDLLAQFSSWRGRFDFLWLLPDPVLYRGQTVSALVLAGIRQGMPVIGFSEGLVRAGALVGFFPDYRDIGMQTGEAVLRLLDGQAQEPIQFPRRSRIAINPNIMRALGIQATAPVKEYFLAP